MSRFEHALTPRTKALWDKCADKRKLNELVSFKEKYPIEYSNIIKLKRSQFLQGLAVNGRRGRKAIR